MTNSSTQNPLGIKEIPTLIAKFCIPTVISMTVASLYNVVDQIFIGHSVGMLGITATNVTFPLNAICIALALLVGIGGASNYNLRLGEKKTEEARSYAGCAFTSLIIIGMLLMIFVLIFINPLLHLFGATADSMTYAQTYLRITAFGMPLYVIGQGGAFLVRSDGSPGFSMALSLAGAIANMILDPVLIFACHMGIAGAAWATTIGQWLSGLMVLYYFAQKSGMGLSKRHFIPRWKTLRSCMLLGIAGSMTNLALAISQCVMNNMLRKYGALSVYGADLPLACVGIVTKINQLFNSICIGIHQGCQPIFSFNYGAQKYARVKKAYRSAATICLVIGIVFLLCMELIPRPIIALFGSGSEEYFAFAIRFVRIFLMMSILNSCFILTSGFFTAIGKPGKGVLMALIKYFFTLLPLTVILPYFIGIDGILFSGPVSDLISGLIGFAFLFTEFRKIKASES